MEAFHSGRPTTLVATDIAARGIHVDDVALVVHADPPVEHKAYLHRSGRTARAGAAGTVITLMTDEQVTRRPRPDPRRRHQADHHPHQRRDPPGAGRARPRRAGHRARRPGRRGPGPARVAAGPTVAAGPSVGHPLGGGRNRVAPRRRWSGPRPDRRPGSSGQQGPNAGSGQGGAGRRLAAGRQRAWPGLRRSGGGVAPPARADRSSAGGQSRHSAASFSSGRR